MEATCFPTHLRPEIITSETVINKDDIITVPDAENNSITGPITIRPSSPSSSSCSDHSDCDAAPRDGAPAWGPHVFEESGALDKLLRKDLFSLWSQ